MRTLVADHPDWSRHRITKHIRACWDWRTFTGQLKTFAARSLIGKLESQQLLTLPPIRVSMRRPPRPLYPAHFIPSFQDAIHGLLYDLQPVSFMAPTLNSEDAFRFGYYLKRHHYLGFCCAVGENLSYLIKDKQGRDLACLLFGSAAWKTAPNKTSK